jgi:putative hydrolase of HD superfamily
MNAKDYLDILHMAERLKDTLRHCTTSKRRTESVAEHSWRMAFMALLLKGEFPQTNIDRVMEMCVIHDLGECFTGDIPTFDKTDADRSREDELLGQWLSSLPDSISERFTSLFREMNEQKTAEAKLFKAIDKLEALIQHNESPIDTWSENERELNKVYAFDTVEFSQWLTSLRKEILSETLEKLGE